MMIDLVVDMVSMKHYALNDLSLCMVCHLHESRVVQSILIICFQFGLDLRSDGRKWETLNRLDPIIGFGIELVFIGGKHEIRLVARILVEGDDFSIVLMHQLYNLQLIWWLLILLLRATLFKDPLRAFNQHLGELIVRLDSLLDGILDFILKAPEPVNRVLPLLPSDHWLG
jgi:hypothetical protein